MRIEFAKAMAQLLQDLANELAYLAQRMIRRNPLLRPNVREKAALILEPSAHRTLPQNNCGKSESPPLRSGELFQQTAREFLLCRSLKPCAVRRCRTSPIAALAGAASRTCRL